MTDGQYQGYQEESRATLSMVLGILGLVLCGIVAPFAWAIGNSEVKAIDAGRRNPENRGTAQAGKILGIVGTVFLALGVVVVVAILMLSVITFSSGNTDSGSGYGEPQVQGQLSPMPSDGAPHGDVPVGSGHAS
jgi:Mn2+/Fe2+ NRAMP family transporter